jgi:hypothetical protein
MAQVFLMWAMSVSGKLWLADQEVAGMQLAPQHPVILFSRRHIDLQRFAGALCPGAAAQSV